MNEQIEKLGEQADLLGECTPTKIPGRYVGYITEEQILKFAELIVRECVNKQMALARNYETPIEGYEPVAPEFLEGTINGLKEGCELLLQHFGVEE